MKSLYRLQTLTSSSANAERSNCGVG